MATEEFVQFCKILEEIREKYGREIVFEPKRLKNIVEDLNVYDKNIESKFIYLISNHQMFVRKIIEQKHLSQEMVSQKIESLCGFNNEWSNKLTVALFSISGKSFNATENDWTDITIGDTDKHDEMINLSPELTIDTTTDKAKTANSYEKNNDSTTAESDINQLQLQGQNKPKDSKSPNTGFTKYRTYIIAGIFFILVLGIFLISNMAKRHQEDVATNNEARSDEEYNSSASLEETTSFLNANEEATLDTTIVDNGSWEGRMSLPEESEIVQYNAVSTSRSPYICGWFSTNSYGNFKEYSVDFKADYVAPFTHCNLANFYLDYAELETQYAKVYCDGISGYAGLQVNSTDNDLNSILSFWDVHCEDSSGQIVNTIRPQLVYPESNENDTFGNEGTGVHHLTEYNWKPNMWYRMLLQCGISETTGNTTIEQWICDLSTNAWTKLCVYDLGIANVSFKGDVAAFLENYDISTSGNIRTMEIKNVRIRQAGSTEWIPIEEGVFSENYTNEGSYNYGTYEDTFWIITTGISGKANSKSSEKLTVNGNSSVSPY